MCAAADANYRVHIHEAQLFLCKVDVSPSYDEAVERSIQEKDAAYEIPRTETKILTINNSLSTSTLENVFPSTFPKRLTIAMVKNSSLTGTYGENPYYFDHHSLSQAVVRVDSRAISHNTIKTNFAKSEYALAYMTLFGSCDGGNADPGNGVSMVEYKNGLTFLCFDLTPDMNASTPGYIYPEVHSNLSIELGFLHTIGFTHQRCDSQRV